MKEGNGERRKYVKKKSKCSQKNVKSFRFVSSGYWVKVNESNQLVIYKNCQVSIFNVCP